MRIGPRGGMCQPCYEDFMSKKGRPVNEPVKRLSTESLQELGPADLDDMDAELEKLETAPPVRARKVMAENGKINNELCACGKPKRHMGRCRSTKITEPKVDLRRKENRGLSEHAVRKNTSAHAETKRGKMLFGNTDLTPLYEDLLRRREQIDKGIAAIEVLIGLQSSSENS